MWHSISLSGVMYPFDTLRNVMVQNLHQFCFCRADVTLTDLPDFVPLLQLNIDNNKDLLKGKAVCQALKWGDKIEDKTLCEPDLILLADCVYYEEVCLHSELY